MFSIACSSKSLAYLSAAISCFVLRRFEPAYSKFAEMPLLATDRKGMMVRDNRIALTTNSRTLTENLCDFRIHLDHDILLYRHLGVAVLDLCLHPFGELFL